MQNPTTTVQVLQEPKSYSDAHCKLLSLSSHLLSQGRYEEHCPPPLYSTNIISNQQTPWKLIPGPQLFGLMITSLLACVKVDVCVEEMIDPYWNSGTPLPETPLPRFHTLPKPINLWRDTTAL